MSNILNYELSEVYDEDVETYYAIYEGTCGEWYSGEDSKWGSLSYGEHNKTNLLGDIIIDYANNVYLFKNKDDALAIMNSLPENDSPENEPFEYDIFEIKKRWAVLYSMSHQIT